MDQGEEAGSASLKESPLDFALWKAHKEGEDTSWDSPWGSGRPAWHIECSVMAEQELGPEFAIHGGGSDLVFPHHENEIAQSEAAGRPFARIWMHNGMIETDAEKMSKSEGNIFQLSEALDRYGREAVVAYLISGHYRQPLAFGAEQMEQAVARVERLRNFFREHPVGGAGEVPSEQQRGGSAGTSPDSRLEAFREALADDFNTPRAMAEVFELVGEANREEVPGRPEAVREMLELVGLSSLTQPDQGAEADDEAEGLLAEREEARAAKDFERADEIRDRLAELGWEVRDSADGARLVPRGWMAEPDRSTGAGRWRRRNGGGGQVRRVWRAPETAAEELERLCGSPDHQGVVAEVDPYPYGDRNALLRGEDALIVALDQVQDPRNLGAVCRSAEFAGRRRAWSSPSGARRRSPPPPARPRPAPSSICGRPRPQPRRLARRRQGRRLLDLGRRRRRRVPPWAVDLTGPTVLVLGGEGKGHPPPGGRRLRRPGRPAAARPDRLPQRLGGGHGAAFRGASPARLSLAGLHNKCNGGCTYSIRG